MSLTCLPPPSSDAYLSALEPALSPQGDLRALQEGFARDALSLLPNALSIGCATRWSEHLASWREWALVTRIQGQHRSFDAEGMDALDPLKRRAFDDLVTRDAHAEFQYLYERYPLYDLGRAGQLSDPLMREIYALLRSEAFLDLARRLCGEPGIAFADGQLTRYRRGHFLTLHDDEAPGMQRVAAYVLQLTPRWTPDFGGQLQMLDAVGEVTHSFSPRFNHLVVFRVPRPHLVSAVAPFVEASRYALTGWLRSGREPALPS
jgi:Rps23 Pro-64 3,4-dihydroxylase Tpa1-like proline 4-hydroxylase